MILTYELYVLYPVQLALNLIKDELISTKIYWDTYTISSKYSVPCNVTSP